MSCLRTYPPFVDKRQKGGLCELLEDICSIRAEKAEGEKKIVLSLQIKKKR